jgi:hypothetical protein
MTRCRPVAGQWITGKVIARAPKVSLMSNLLTENSRFPYVFIRGCSKLSRTTRFIAGLVRVAASNVILYLIVQLCSLADRSYQSPLIFCQVVFLQLTSCLFEFVKQSISMSTAAYAMPILLFYMLASM